MLDDMRKYMRAGIEALAAGRSEDFTAAVVSRAQSVAEQMSALASGFLEWSAEARASLLHEVKELVARQVNEMGLATKQDMDALRKRIGADRPCAREGEQDDDKDQEAGLHASRSPAHAATKRCASSGFDAKCRCT